jgi:hypothetical protein
MDQKLFLEKLSQVADWDWQPLPGQTNHNWRGEDEVEPPEDIRIIKLKSQYCDIKTQHHAKTIIKNYTHNKTKFAIERCPSCGWARTTKTGWFEVVHLQNIAQQVWVMEHGYEREPKVRNRFVVTKDANGHIHVRNGRQVISEDENSVITAHLDK